MKAILFSLALCISVLSSCKDDDNNPIPAVFTVPNGDMELWDSAPLPLSWTTNSCPMCLSPYEQYIVRMDTASQHDSLAALLIYNNMYPAWMENRFAVPAHPQSVSAWVKLLASPTDSVIIQVSVIDNNTVVDGGVWYGTGNINTYTEINIPISQNSSSADSAVIYIQGGKVGSLIGFNTMLWVDNVTMQ